MTISIDKTNRCATILEISTMLKIRLHRVGRRNDPSFRLVVVESTVGPQKAYLESLGNYNPKQKTRNFNADRIVHWIGHGAQPSDTVHNLLVSEKIITGKKRNVLPKKQPIAQESDKKEEVSASQENEKKSEVKTENETQPQTPVPDTGSDTPQEESENQPQTPTVDTVPDTQEEVSNKTQQSGGSEKEQ